MAVGDVNIRGVKVANEATQVKLYGPDGSMSDSHATKAPPAVVDLGATVEIRNFMMDFTVRRTTNTPPNYQYVLQSVTPSNQNTAWVKAALEVDNNPGLWFSQTFITEQIVYGPAAWPAVTSGPQTGLQFWVYRAEVWKPPADTGNSFHWEDNGYNGEQPFKDTPDPAQDPEGVALYHSGSYVTPTNATYPATGSQTLLLLNQDYRFRFWAIKQASNT